MSNRNHRLFEKLNLFEKLALYGSRRSFLKSIAQQTGLSPQAKDLLSRLIDNVAAFPSMSSLLGSLQNAFDAETPDVSALTKTVQQVEAAFAKAGPEHAPQAQIAQQLLAALPGGQPAAETGQPTSLSAPKAPGATAGTTTRIDPQVQQLLSEFMVSNDLGAPLPKIDGLISPNGPTRWALNKVKQTLKNPNMSDNEVFSLLKMPGKMEQMVAAQKGQLPAPGTQEALKRSQQDLGALDKFNNDEIE
jgi:hypothetical protein